MIKILFFINVFIIFYVYLGYPLLVVLLSFFRKKSVLQKDEEPNVTILIAAFNEERCIANTLKNKLELDYPGQKIEIIVISDASTDKTDELVKQFASQGVKLIRQTPRSGKTSALNLAVPVAQGEILIFSDANSIYSKNAIRNLVRNFGDPTVGYATGKMIYTNPDGSTIGDGCSLYMKYENFLRVYETKLGSIVGVDGGIDSARKSLFQPMNPDQLPDFVLPLKIIEQGYRVVYEPEAILQEPALNKAKDEYRMRVRVALRALWALSDMRHLLSWKNLNLYGWQLWSHKLLRYLCFLFLLQAYFYNLILFSDGYFYKFCFVAQNLLYIGALLSPLIEENGFNSRLLYTCRYFVLLNTAAGHAFVKFLFRKKQVQWVPRKG